MRREYNPELDNVILEHLTEKYKLAYHRSETDCHLSTYNGCLTKAFWEARAPVDPTPKECMFFAVGLGLQDLLTPDSAETPLFEKDGITFRPDYMMKLYKDEYHELKTTRLGEKRIMEALPKSWIKYMEGGCWIRGLKHYHLTALLLIPARLWSETIYFDEIELEDNWQEVLERKAIVDAAFTDNIPPVPFDYNLGEWECKECRYRTLCDAVAMSK